MTKTVFFYCSDENGRTKGFFIDLLLAVCERAHKRCNYMVDAGSHCWRTDGERERPGIGKITILQNYIQYAWATRKTRCKWFIRRIGKRLIFVQFEGLLDHFYDGCIGYWQSAARRNSFNFSLPFMPNVRASLHYKAGETVENATTVTGKKIGV